MNKTESSEPDPCHLVYFDHWEKGGFSLNGPGLTSYPNGKKITIDHNFT